MFETTRWTLAAALVLAAVSPGTAEAGWTAKQESRSTPANPAGPAVQAADLTFDKGFFRIDQDASTSVIIDFNAGKFMFLNHKDKKHAAMTVEQLIAMRDASVAQMKAQLPNLPPDIRAKIEEQIKEIEGGKPKPEATPKATGKSETVNGYDCKVYTWKQPDGDNEACIASKVGVDVGEFIKSATKLSDKLTAVSGGRGGMGSFAMIELGKHGFPVRTRKTMKMGETTIDAISEVKEIKTAKIDPSKFAVPAGYAEGDLQSVMMGSAAPPPGGPGRPGQPPAPPPPAKK